MSSKPTPSYLRELIKAVTEFDEAFRDFLRLHEPNTFARGLMPAVFRRDGVDDLAYERLQRQVEVASGRATPAVGLTGTRYEVAGFGVVDPIAAWATILGPKPVLDPENITSACGQMIGRLEVLLLEAEAEAVPAVSAETMHPLVWGAARSMWRDSYYRQAVAGAAEALVGQLKARTGRNNIAETALWQETFSEKPAQPGKPRLRWPGDPEDRTVRSMNEGLRQITAGTQMTIRNVAAHETKQWDLVEASERLAVLSLIARWVETCVLEEADLDHESEDVTDR
ncbi:TIGR02391 family protein [Curtobacterium sp. MCBD17_030]|uniref:TIGR02391 family protein n=1 Tax=Curtobacterium sp. MCBD17_030 TaxID=2175649 RepID=UPI000DA0CC2E|nr:TIGR02391 family protein [Curtobacterium sp. MCBD17_030]PYY31540.1 TIGR02391 family protein [Curtobacterium sp. MCBD17_030]